MDFFKDEVTIAFGSHYVCAKLHQRNHYIHVYTINHGDPGADTRKTAKFWLKIFEKQIFNLSKPLRLRYKVMLRCDLDASEYLCREDSYWTEPENRSIWIDASIDVSAVYCFCQYV